MKLTPQVYQIALKNKLYSSLKIQFEKQIDSQCFLPKSLGTWFCELQICPFYEKTQMKHTMNLEWVFDMFYDVKYAALIFPLDMFTELLNMACLKVWLLL